MLFYVSNTNTNTGGDYSDESDVILPKRIFVKHVAFFAVQLVGDNTLHFKSFVKSK